MPQQSLIDCLLDLGKAGCQGNASDFSCWARFCGAPEAKDSVNGVLESLVSQGKFRVADTEFFFAGPFSFPSKVEYRVSGVLQEAPIQMVRSRLDSFLRFHRASEDEVIDVSIATTEAMENAVKYSDHQPINVGYWIDGHTFHIKIVNTLREVKPEADIEAGKYSSSYTLMRGMMVMVKLFDDVNIDISEEKNEAVFSAHKKLAG